MELARNVPTLVKVEEPQASIISTNAGPKPQRRWDQVLGYILKAHDHLTEYAKRQILKKCHTTKVRRPLLGDGHKKTADEAPRRQ